MWNNRWCRLTGDEVSAVSPCDYDKKILLTANLFLIHDHNEERSTYNCSLLGFYNGWFSNTTIHYQPLKIIKVQKCWKDDSDLVVIHKSVQLVPETANTSYH